MNTTEIKNLLAKSESVSFINHSRNVSAAAVYIGKKILSVSDEKIIEAIRISGLLHDIGKLTEDFQKILRHQIKKTKHKFRHNEIGGAFIYKFLKAPNQIPIEQISNVVYWHHGISNKMNNDCYEKVLDNLTSDEIQLMREVTIELLGDSCFLLETRFKSEDVVKTPKFYSDISDINQKMSVIRTCVISGDRIISMLEEQNPDLLINENNIYSVLDKIINDKVIKNNKHIINKSPYQPEDRFILQLEIGKKCEQTTVIKAPAGFGKTLVGLIWASLNNRKTLWVCPRNVVAQSVYISILKELKALKMEDITVELYLTGTVEAKNHTGIKEFNSDIIVTNIDNFLSPSINDSIADRLFLIYTANVVFDEYHEFISDAPYFASFINLMKSRHRSTDSKTLLLSASPCDINYFWDSMEKKTLILPNDKEHYPAVHNKKYLFRVQTGLTYDKNGSDLIIKNSISNSQFLKDRYPNGILFHSEFIDEEKKRKFNEIMSMFGKESERTEDKKPVLATIIARASFDISFHHLYESCMGPESTVQSVGRCDRFGDYQTESIITICRPDIMDFSERAVIRLLYDEDLMELWYQELKPYDGKRITLNELYVIYNSHIEKNKSQRKRYFNKKHINSLTQLTNLYPIKYPNGTKKTGVHTAGSNKLRTTGFEIFYLVPYYNNPQKYAGPFTWHVRTSIQEDFNEDDRIRGRIRGSMKTIMKDKNNTEFDYNEILKNKRITIDEIRKYGKKSNTPYFRYDEVYHPTYGLITESDLDKMKNK